MKPTPELINDWHEKARQMALQADGYFDDVEHWRHFAELAAAWGAEKARQTTDPLGFQIRRAIAAEDELRATKQTLEHAYAALQKVADAQAATAEEPELPESEAIRHSFDGYGWMYIDNGHGSGWRSGNYVVGRLFTAAQMQDYAAAKVREAMAQQGWAAEIDTCNSLLRQALEALENSVDYAEGELTERTRMWSNLPSRAKHLTGLKELADAHVAAITAIKQHLGEV